MKWHVSEGFLYEAGKLEEIESGRASSVLQRLSKAFKQASSDESRTAVVLCSNSPVDPKCSILARVRTANGQLDMRAARGQDGSFTAPYRSWQEHLGLSDADFAAFLSALRFKFNELNKPMFQDFVRLELLGAGFDVPNRAALAPFIDAYLNQVSESAKRSFTREELVAFMGAAGIGRKRADRANMVGIRSYAIAPRPEEDGCDVTLDFSDDFDGALPLTPAVWEDVVQPAISELTDKRLPRRQRIALRLDCHQSIAFAVGLMTAARRGFDATVVPRSWHTGAPGIGVTAMADWREDDLVANPTSEDLALILSVTRPIGETVRSGISDLGLSGAAVKELTVGASSSATSIKSLEHADRLAEAVSHRLASALRGSSIARVHLFLAGPVELAFLLGQRWLASGRLEIVLYEFNKDPRRPGYQKSFHLIT